MAVKMIRNGNVTQKTKDNILMNVSDVFVHIMGVNNSTPKLKKGHTCSVKTINLLTIMTFNI